MREPKALSNKWERAWLQQQGKDYINDQTYDKALQYLQAHNLPIKSHRASVVWDYIKHRQLSIDTDKQSKAFSEAINSLSWNEGVVVAFSPSVAGKSYAQKMDSIAKTGFADATRKKVSEGISIQRKVHAQIKNIKPSFDALSRYYGGVNSPYFKATNQIRIMYMSMMFNKAIKYGYQGRNVRDWRNTWTSLLTSRDFYNLNGQYTFVNGNRGFVVVYA